MHAYAISLFRTNTLSVKRDYDFTPTVTVMIAAFNEGSAVYDTVKSVYESNYPHDKFDIILADDCSKDDTYEWMQKAAADFPRVTAYKNAVNKGKAPTMAALSEIATGEYIVCTDADTVFDPNAIRELICCFTSDDVGAVGGVIGIINVNQNLLTQMQTFFYGTSFWVFKPIDNFRGTAQCQGGPLVAFKTSVYREIMPDVLTRHFLGSPQLNGEDRYITQCILLKGLKAYNNLDARCWVGTPYSFDTYLKQQLRWRRSAIGQWCNTMFNLRKYIRQSGVYITIGSVMPINVTLLWLFMFWWMIDCGIILQFLAWVCALKIVISPIFSVIYNRLIARVDKTQVINNPILTAWLILPWFVISVFVVTTWSMFTLDDGSWVTRQNGTNGNS